jgi:hypothetical protein
VALKRFEVFVAAPIMNLTIPQIALHANATASAGWSKTTGAESDWFRPAEELLC